MANELKRYVLLGTLFSLTMHVACSGRSSIEENGVTNPAPPPLATIAPTPPEKGPDPSKEDAAQNNEEQARIDEEKEEEDRIRLDREANESKKQEQAKLAALEKAIADAPVFEAPLPGRRGSNIDTFTARMRSLASDEFTLKDATSQVFRATFKQRNLDVSPAIKVVSGRNTMVYSPKYDFTNERVTLQLEWYIMQAESNMVGGDQFPETTDRCSLLTTISLDEKTAREWRQDFNAGNFGITIWFRPKSFVRSEWRQMDNARMIPQGNFVHDICLEVETLKFERN